MIKESGKAPVKTGSDDKGDSGCLACFLFGAVLVVLDAFGISLALAAPAGYGPLVMALGVVGFAGGVALGIYLSAKVVPPTAWSSYYWLIGGLIGIALPTAIIHVIFMQR